MFMKNKAMLAAVVAGLAVGSIAIAQMVQPKSVGSESFFLIGSNGNSLELKPGTIGASYSLTLPDADGTNGQVMQTDGAGTLSWTSAATSGVPSGTIITFGGATCPAGYLPADGTAVSRTTYSALFSAISTTWGTGNGSTTFNVPDLRNRFLRGTGTNGANGGDVVALGAYQADEVKAHTHTQNAGVNIGVSGTIGIDNAANRWNAGPTASTGGNESRPKSYGVLMCIKE